METFLREVAYKGILPELPPNKNLQVRGPRRLIVIQYLLEQRARARAQNGFGIAQRRRKRSTLSHKF